MHRRYSKQARIHLKVPADPKKQAPKTRVDVQRDNLPLGNEPDTFEELEKARKKGSILGKFNNALQDALQSSRGDARTRDAAREGRSDPSVTADDLAISRAKSVRAQRMIVPEGVIIQGAMSSGSETEIAGRIEGDVTIDGRLYLAPSALISGSVRSTFCKVEGLVEGRMECSQELDLGKTGRLNADALAAKKMTIAGQVFGNITCGGLLRLLATARVTGDIRTRILHIEEGAVFNGKCATTGPNPKSK